MDKLENLLQKKNLVYCPGNSLLLLLSSAGNFTFADNYADLKLQLAANTFETIILLCEVPVDVDNKAVKRQELYGIEMAKQLRKDDITLPIVFTSFLSRKQAFNNKIDRGILNAIGHGFLSLPFTAMELQMVAEKTNSLNNLELYDVIHNYCSLAGAVKMLLHSLNGLQSSRLESESDRKTVADKLRTSITQVHELFKQEPTSEISKFNSRFNILNKENLNEAIRFVESIGTDLMEGFAPSEQLGKLIKATGGWSILLLDDEITAEHPLVEKMIARDVKVLCAKNAEEAYNHLAAERRIVLVLSDYRLETDEDGIMIHQPVQGYQFLKQLSDERPGYMRLAALSSLPRKFLMQSFRHYGIRVEVFSKKDYLENSSTLEILCDELVDLGNDNNEAIVRLPRITSETWEQFEPYYRHHRNSFSYIPAENYIGQRAREYCEGVLKNEYSFDLKGYTALNFNAKKAAVGDLPGGAVNEKYYKIFLEKCICRRVAIWYSRENPDWQLLDVLKVIKGKSFTGEEKDNTAKNQINFNLALSLSEYPWNMTQEEKQWLVYCMGAKDVEATEKLEAAILLQCFEAIEEWLENHYLKDQLTKNEIFKPYYAENQAKYGLNFKVFKSFLHYLYLLILNDGELIKSLQSQLISLAQSLPDTEVTTNVAIFKNYLEFFRKKLAATKTLNKGDTEHIGTWETFLEKIAAKVVGKIPENQHPIFRGSAYEFFAINKDIPFASESQKVAALLEFHHEQIREWYGQGVMEYDERKTKKRNADNSVDDY